MYLPRIAQFTLMRVNIVFLTLLTILIPACSLSTATRTPLTSTPLLLSTPTLVIDPPTSAPFPTATPTPSATNAAVSTQSTTLEEATAGRYHVYELDFNYPSSGYTNPWDAATLTVTFTLPSGVRVEAGGFYVASDTWKVRFAPSELGRYFWRSEFAAGSSMRTDGGAFTVIESGEHGFIRHSAANPFRWVFDDGTPYYPIGLQDCTNDRDHSGDPFDDFGFDGGFRPHNTHIGSKTDMDTYFDAYAAAGFNLWRWTVDNCSFKFWEQIAPEGNIYLPRELEWGDKLVTVLRTKGFRIYANIFGFEPPFPQATAQSSEMEAIKRYVRYFVNRYAAYVDFWDLMNEATASEEWYRAVAEAVREYDPYDHPLATSWERPDLAVIDINSPHWYQTENELESDQVTAERIRLLRQGNKPIVFSEHGNAGVNWDERSGTRMRLRTWTAFFEEATIIFWNSSFGKDYHADSANIYLGPEERGYVRALQDFTAGFDPAAQPVPVITSSPDRVRAYGLRSASAYAVYLVNFTDHANPTSGVHLIADVPVAGTAVWYDPATGTVVASLQVAAGQHPLLVPDFVTDIALKITAEG